jgi:ethanolamine utilization protein EutQ (cupin superfamily)
LRDKDGRIDYLKQIIDETELEKHQMNMVIQEKQSKFKGNESTIFESEEKRVLL